MVTQSLPTVEFGDLPELRTRITGKLLVRQGNDDYQADVSLLPETEGVDGTARDLATEAGRVAAEARSNAGTNAADIVAERALRAAGDRLRSVTVSSEAELTRELATQATSDIPLELLFSAGVSAQGTTYPERLLAYVPPRSQDLVQRFILESGGDADPTEQRVVEADSASAATVGRVAIDHGGAGLFTTVERNVPQRLATWRDDTYTHANFLGVFASSPDPSAHTVGHWYANPFSIRPRVLVQRTGYKDWDTTTWQAVGITTFRGGASEPRDIADRIEANGDIWLDTDDYALNVVRDFVAGQAGGDEYHDVHYATTEALEQGLERKQDTLPVLGAGQVRVGPENTPTDLGDGAGGATTQQLADEATAREGADTALGGRIDNLVEDIQQSALHVSILWPDGTSSPLSYMNARTVSELFQRNPSQATPILNTRSPIGFQIEGYIKGFNGLANLQGIFINGAVARGNTALTTEERISDGHFNLVAHPTNRALGNIVGSLDQGFIAFTVRYSIDGQPGIYEVRLPVDTRPPRDLPNRVPYIHPEYLLDDILRRVSELRVQESAQIWEAINAGQAQIAGISAASATGIAILSGTFDPSNIPAEVVWGYSFTQLTTASQRIVLLGRIPINDVARQDQLDDRYRLVIARDTHPTVRSTVGGPIAEADNFYYLHLSGAEANPSDRIVFSLERLTNPFRTIYDDLLGPRAIASIPEGMRGGSVEFGAGSGQVAVWAEGDNLERFPLGKIPSLRDLYATAGTPAAGDRWFFTDENQPNDPVRYIQHRDLVALILAGVSSGNVITDPAVAASADTVGKLRFVNGRLFTTVFHHAAAPTVAYRDFTQADWRTAIGDNNAEWGGAVQVTSPANQHPANYGVYSIPSGHFEVRRGSGFPAGYSLFEVANWRGGWGSKAEADAHVEAIGDVVYYTGGGVRVATSYRAGTTRGYSWEPVEAVPAEGSVTSDKLGTDAGSEKAAFRLKIGAVRFGVGNALPPAAETNIGDFHLFNVNVASGLTWRNFDGTPIASARAFDIAVYTGARFWQRAGNLVTGRSQLTTQTITSAAALAWNLNLGYTGLVTLAHNATLTITGGASGETAKLIVTQDSTGSRTLTLGRGISRFAGVAAPVLKTAAASVDVLEFLNIGGTWTFIGTVKAAPAGPRPITGAGNVYTLGENEHSIMVMLTRDGHKFPLPLIRADLSGALQEYWQDSHNPTANTKNQAMGVNASISGNDATITVSGFASGSAIGAVYGIS